MGARPDGWWNDRRAAAARLAQRIAEWCRTHHDAVTVVFDGPVDERTGALAGGNLRIEEATRRGRDAADHLIVELVERETSVGPGQGVGGRLLVVTSDRGLVERLPEGVEVMGAGTFRNLVEPQR
jgi:hypothetical protein